MTDVLSSCSGVPSLSHPWTTCRTQALADVVPQPRPSSSSSPPPSRAPPSGSVEALRPVLANTSRAPASISYTCVEVRLLFPKAPTVARQVVGPAPPTGSRWKSAFRPPRVPRLLSSHHTSRPLAACCTLTPSSIPALSHSDREQGHGNKVALCVVYPEKRLSSVVFKPGSEKPGLKVHLIYFVKRTDLSVLGLHCLPLFLN